MPKALDLTGQIFGNLKAISKAPSKGKKTYWLCECLLCGNQKEQIKFYYKKIQIITKEP